MKPVHLLFVFLFVAFFIILSCTSSPQELSPEHESIIGTKWISVVPNSDDSITFNDRSFCTFIINGRQQRISYSVSNNRIIIGNNLYSFVRRDDALYLVGYPAFIKE